MSRTLQVDGAEAAPTGEGAEGEAIAEAAEENEGTIAIAAAAMATAAAMAGVTAGVAAGVAEAAAAAAAKTTEKTGRVVARERTSFLGVEAAVCFKETPLTRRTTRKQNKTKAKRGDENLCKTTAGAREEKQEAFLSRAVDVGREREPTRATIAGVAETRLLG